MNVHYPLGCAVSKASLRILPRSGVSFQFSVRGRARRSSFAASEIDDSNLALACRACNLFKSNHLTGTPDDGEEGEALFHPRNQQWDEHFRVDLDTGVVSGLTRFGLATIARLRMNAATQVTARNLWIRLGLYP